MRTDTDQNARELAVHLALLRETLNPEEDTAVDTALCTVETFCAVALRVMAKTNPSKIRDCARTVEIKARMDGTPVVRGAA